MKSVLIVGSGPAGMIAAIELTRLGKEVEIIDRRDRGISSKRRLISLNSRSLELLEKEGILPELLKAGNKINKINLRSNDKSFVCLDFSIIDHKYPFLLNVKEDTFYEILHKKLESLKIKIQHNTEFIKFEQDESQITVFYKIKNKECNKVYDFVIGADGINSKIRKLINSKFEGYVAHNCWSIADVKMEYPYNNDECNIFMHNDVALVVMPLKDNRYRVVSNSYNTVDKISNKFKVEEVYWHNSFELSFKQVTNYRLSRVILIGDAAHTHSPALGRGVNLGIEDAFSVAYRIVEGGAVGFSDIRRNVGRKVFMQSRFLLFLVTNQNFLVRFFVTKILGPLFDIKPIQKFFIRNLLGYFNQKL